MDSVHLKNAEVIDLDKEIMDFMLDANLGDGRLDVEELATENFQREVNKMKRKLDVQLFPRTEVRAAHAHDVMSSAASLSGNQSSFSGQSRQHRPNIKYPKVKPREFGGDLKDWIGFWAQFKKIDEDDDLDDSDKFDFLFQHMTPDSEAFEIVNGFPPCAANYPKAVEALKTRYGNESLLVQVYVRDLLRLAFRNLTEKVPLAKMFLQMKSHLRALDSLNLATLDPSTWLFPLVESSLNEDQLRAWQRSPLSKAGIGLQSSQLDRLLEFMESEVSSEQRIQLAQVGFLDVATGKKSQPQQKWSRPQKKDDRDSIPTAAGLFAGKSPLCIFCDGNHDSGKCFKAQKMALDEKIAIATSKKACHWCLIVGHPKNRCKGKIRCVVCQKRHETTMCPEVNWGEKKEQVPVTRTNLSCSQEVLLQSLMVTIVNGSKRKQVRALCDPGAQNSYVLQSTATELGMVPQGELKMRHSLFSGRSYVQDHFKYLVTLKRIRSNVNDLGSQLEVLDQLQICKDIPRLTKGPWMDELKTKKIWLSDVGEGTPEIEILIGSDMYPRIFTGRSHVLTNGLLAIETTLGWTLSGKEVGLPSTSENSVTMATTSLSLHLKSEHLSITDLWNLEAIGISEPSEHKSKAEKDEEVKGHFLKSVSRTADSRYKVKMPWIDGQPKLPNNRVVAERRLEGTTKKLLEKGHFATYDQIFEDWLKEGFIEEVSEEVNSGHFIPHHPVFKPGSLTTPVRPVFDASCKSQRMPSLNDCLQKGPNLMELIPTVLLRFREYLIGVISDIRKAFQMIEVADEDRNFLKFLWWEDAGLKTYRVFRHKRVVFGVNCSPFQLAAVLELHLKGQPEEVKVVMCKLWKSLYVDNCVTSVENPEELRQFRDTAIKVMKEAKMDLRCWEFTGDLPDKPKTAVLGLTWDKSSDYLGLDLEHLEAPVKVTKRSILSTVHKVFDPLGFASPTTILPKILLQEAWAKDEPWDHEVNEEISVRFLSWVTEVNELRKLKISRYMLTSSLNKTGMSLHVFCDASQDAYATVIFVRTETVGGAKVRLVQSKSRVCPLKRRKGKDGVVVEQRTSIPRLELLAATVGSRLTKMTKDALDWQEVPTFYWSDSTTVIAWIRNNDDWGTFVGNRVKEIISITDPTQWRHIPGERNPADLPSRGCTPSQFLASRWWEGPDWLYRPQNQWPASTECFDEDQVNLERKKTTRSMAVTSRVRWFQPKLSSYLKKVTVMAWTRRFIHNCRSSSRELQHFVTIQELRAAESELLKIVQDEAFPGGAATIQSLKVMVDNEGLIRVKSKLLWRTDSFGFRSPILLPKDHTWVIDLIRHVHVTSCHGGAQVVVGLLREKYWVICARQAVNKVIHQCVTCRRFSSQNATVEPAPLPSHRVATAEAFQNVGVDLAGGPLFLIGNEKVYLVLYTCAVYRAVHLDLVTSLSTEAFLLSLERFVNSTGRPNVIHSDNGTNFVGAANVFKLLNWDEIEAGSKLKGFRWIFNPPTAAWWGGWWEKLIRTTKELLRKMLGRAKLTYDELRTCIASVEGVINTRPLTTVTDDPDDLIPLTPMMFVRPLHQVQFPEAEINSKFLQGRYQKMQQLKLGLQARFRREYLALLVQKAKEKRSVPLKTGDVVLVGDYNKKRFEWPLGRIVELISGRDNNVRVAKVQVLSNKLFENKMDYETKVVTRPLQNLYPLEVRSTMEGPEITRNAVVSNDPIQSSSVLEQKDLEHRTKSGRVINSPRRYGSWNY